MFSRKDRLRDTLAAAAALVGIAALLTPLLLWLLQGMDASGQDMERFEKFPRTGSDIATYGGMLMALAAMVLTAIVLSISIALWLVVGGLRARSRAARPRGR